MKQRGSLPQPTDQDAIVGPHADDDDCIPPQPHPDLSSTGEERNNISLLSVPSAVDESFDYQSELVRIDAIIEQMKQRRPLPQPIDQDHSTTPCSDDYLHSGLSQPPNPSATDEPLDHRSKLAETAKKIERMKQQSTNTSPFTITCYELHETADSETVKEGRIDPTLLNAVTSLDNFLIQYPRQLNLPANIPCYQPLLN